MFFLAGDNNLSPGMISELKALKDAGFQQNTTVLAHFDPNELGAPTRIFNINQKRKSGKAFSVIGEGRDPYVHHLDEDQVKPEMIDASRGEASRAVREAFERRRGAAANLPRGTTDADARKEPTVAEALKDFLGFCREQHPANHYMLFLIGHGLIVGNDAFLPDEHPVSSVSLEKLEEILRRFGDGVRGDGGEFQLLGLHSCSMSAVEVAYQLKGTANYMIGTQGLSYVGCWPYRKLLVKSFNAVERMMEKRETDSRAAVDVALLVKDIYSLSLHSATDFSFAGYSFDQCLCRMRAREVEKLTEPIQELVRALKRGLGPVTRPEDEDPENGRVKRLVLLAHWESQSFWQEMYTDLFDFCLCLSRSCDAGNGLQKPIIEACEHVMAGLTALVVHSDNFGSKYMYAHGLSIYFPWSRPDEETDGDILARYQNYAFNKELRDDSWLSFLDLYFDRTQRLHRQIEEGASPRKNTDDILAEPEADRFLRAAAETFDPTGVLSDGPKPIPSMGDDPKPIPSVGGVCQCPSIKNYPKVRVDDDGATRKLTFSMTEGAAEAFK
jgi:hypothetical protein